MKDFFWAVTGFTSGNEDTPLFTNLTRTYEGALIVDNRFKEQGLLTKIYDLSTGDAPGCQPYLEKDL